MRSKKEIKEIIESIKMVATHCYFNGQYFPLSMGFFTSDGRIDDTCLAVLAADYLVQKKKIGFRIAHHIVSDLSSYMQKKNKMFYQLSLTEYNQFCYLYTKKKQLFDEDIFNIMRIPVSVKASSGELSLEKLFN